MALKPLIYSELSKIDIITLTKSHAKGDLVKGLISLFLNTYKIRTNNNFLKQIIKSTNSDTVNSLQEFFEYRSRSVTLDIIHKIFEELIPVKKRQKYGIVYTPQIIVRHIIERAITKNTKTICDCSCGTGVFLLESIKKIQRMNNNIAISSIIENYIYGVDVLKEHIDYTKIILTLYMLTTNEDKKKINFNLITEDSLSMDWKKYFPNVFKNGGFDAIVGNPPYVRIQDMSITKRRKLELKWNTCIGSFNLYFPFFELGMNILNSHGCLGYITSNSFFTSFAGLNLRKWLQQNRFMSEILNFTHLVLFDATSYTCIIILDKKHKTSFQYNYLENYADLMKLDQVRFNTNLFTDLDYTKWRLLKNDEKEIISKLENIGRPLGKISQINSGIATLKDKLYFLPYCKKRGLYYEKIYDGIKFLIEKNITRKIVKISSIDINQHIAEPTHRIIFPYEKNQYDKYILISEKQIKTKYPKCYKYLLYIKNELLKRDKGNNKNYKSWYSYGRQQGFNVDGLKILTPTFSKYPRFILDKGGTFFCNGYAIHNSNIPLDVLQKILNSKIMEYYIRRTSVFIEGGYSCFQKNFIERFNIPELSSDDIQEIKQTQDTNKLDKILMKKYQLVF